VKQPPRENRSSSFRSRCSIYNDGVNMTNPGNVVYLVDDEACIREAIADLLNSAEIKVVTFESAASFLGYEHVETAGCLLLDLQLPDMSGLELQQKLDSSSSLPIVFLSGHGDIPSSVRAMKAGAVDFLTKPVQREALFAAVETAFVRDRERRRHEKRLSELQHRLALLSPREREVLPLVAAGFLNKQSAAMLGITEITLQSHRGQIMRKMAAESFADLVRMCSVLGVTRSTNSVNPSAEDPPTASLARGLDRIE
jgi:FixJ family two-component response regulator